MSNDDLDDFDETAEPVEDEVEEEGEAAASSDEGGGGGGGGGITRTETEEAEALTPSAKEAVRRQLEEEMERFLASGGQIKEIPPDVTSEPPQKPTSSYGSKPI